jgi:nucleoside-diphosphate-sugar epimerase
MSARKQVLLTGAGGVLGTELLARLRDLPTVAVTGVTRSGDAAAGVDAWYLGAEPCPEHLRGRWDVVVHCAASTRWNMTADEARAANVQTTEALAAVVGPTTHLIHISTAFAGGLRGSVASEQPTDYRNHYEWSKAAAERLVRNRHRTVTIVRPPLIIGRRSDGYVSRSTGIYTFFRAAGTGTAPVVVAEPDAFLEMAPVDDVAARIVEHVTGPPPAAPVIDMIGRGADAPRVSEALELAQAGINDVRKRHGRAPLEPTPIVSPARWERFHLPFARGHLDQRQLQVLELLSAFAPYLQIREPFLPQTTITDVRPVLRRSMAAWADAHRGVGLAEPHAWMKRLAA